MVYWRIVEDLMEGNIHKNAINNLSLPLEFFVSLSTPNFSCVLLHPNRSDPPTSHLSHHTPLLGNGMVKAFAFAPTSAGPLAVFVQNLELASLAFSRVLKVSDHVVRVFIFFLEHL